LERAGEIVDFIAKDRPQAAVDWLDGLEDRLTSLPGLPEQGRVVPEWFEPTVRELIYLRHRVIYEVHSDRVDILTIRHSRQRIGGRDDW
jgi:plasmid stabilization system protein ParE